MQIREINGLDGIEFVTRDVAPNGQIQEVASRLQPHTFKSTGVSAYLRPIPPFLLRTVGKTLVAPEPPEEEVPQIDGTTRKEKNRAHPDYIAAMKAYDERVNEATADLIVTRGVFLALTDAMRDEVKQLREFMKSRFGVDLDADDMTAYVKHIAIGTPEELRELILAVTAQSVPTDPLSKSG